MNKFLVIRIDNHLFAVSAKYVRDVVLLPQKIMPVPLASSEIKGLFNLRGDVVTVIDLNNKTHPSQRMNQLCNKCVVIDIDNNPYCLLIEEVRGIYDISSDNIENISNNTPEEWKEYSTGIYKLENELIVILNIEGLLRRLM